MLTVYTWNAHYTKALVENSIGIWKSRKSKCAFWNYCSDSSVRCAIPLSKYKLGVIDNKDEIIMVLGDGDDVIYFP